MPKFISFLYIGHLHSKFVSTFPGAVSTQLKRTFYRFPFFPENFVDIRTTLCIRRYFIVRFRNIRVHTMNLQIKYDIKYFISNEKAFG